MKPRVKRCWGDSLPDNFSWLSVNKIAGSACPRSELELMCLMGLGIRVLITLSPETLPPMALLQERTTLSWHQIDVQNFRGATISQFQKFFSLCEEKTGGDSILVHCQSGRGRTGMFLAAYIMYFTRVKSSEAIQTVRSMRPRSIETKEQEKSLRELGRFLQLE